MSSPFESGQTVGRYRILRPLGSGAMGVVYLAQDPQIERFLAIKTVRLAPDEPTELAERSERLLREAKTAGRLIHPHIVTLFDAGEHQGTLYLAFEYVEGSNLAERIREGAPLTLAEALRITGEAAAGLTFAHHRGIVHRDVKPANLLLAVDGRIKISDFGIAKVLGEATELTMTGTVVGSPHYLSPEQVRGEPLDGRSDLFSLGVVLYELLGARRPFDGDTLTTLLYQILHQEPPPMALRPAVSPRLVEVLSRLLAKDRNDRYADGDELIGALAALETELPPEVLAAPAVIAGSDGQVEPTRLLEMTGALPVAPATRPAEAPGEPAATRAPAIPPPPGAVPPPPPPGAAAPESASVSAMPAPPVAVARPAGRRKAWVAAAAVLAVLVALGGLAAVGGYVWWQRGGGERVAGMLSPGPERPNRPRPEAEVDRVEDSSPAGVQGSGSRVQAPTLPGSSSKEAGLDPAGTRPGPSPVVSAEGRPVTSGGAAAGPAQREPPIQPQPEVAAPAPGPPESLPEPAPSEAPIAEEASAEPHPEPEPRLPPAARRLERALEERPALRRAVEDVVARSTPDQPDRPDQEIETGLALVFDVRPAEAFALLDGTVVGRVREHDARSGQAYVLPGAGEYLLKLRSPGMEDHRILVRASASGPERTTVSARLRPAAAAELALGDLPVVRVRHAVGFDVQPPSAEIEVNGRRIGRAERYPGRFARPATWLRLPAGRHRLSLVAPGFERRDFAVDVSAGAEEERRRIEVRLARAEGPS